MVTKEQVLEAQKNWADGVVKIGEIKDNRPECETYTSEFVDNLYSFNKGPVLFKPTRCAIEQFRSTKLKALSYFIAGNNRSCEEDTGFAIQPWTKVRFENTDIILEENRAIAMGNYFFTDVNGNEAKVEYTFGYKLVNKELKIDVHHSSFSYQS